MVELIYPKHYRTVQRLPFCYVCGEDVNYAVKAGRNEDHVPPKALFASGDRRPLMLPTHKECNGSQSPVDQRMGEVIGLLWQRRPKSHKDAVLRLRIFNGPYAAIIGLDIDSAVWRWIRGFHAALYGKPLTSSRRFLVTPFPRSKDDLHLQEPEALTASYWNCMRVITSNRARSNLDRIVTNNQKMTYECVWSQADNNGPWLCFFALDIYGWRELGDPRFGQRDCGGCYVMSDGSVPAVATRSIELSSEASIGIVG